jgi:hypothetical protein
MLIFMALLLVPAALSGTSSFTEANKNFITTEVSKAVKRDKNAVLASTLEVIE